MKKRHILLLCYIILLLAVLATMTQLYTRSHTPHFTTRDYPAIAEEGILRVITEYDQLGYYVSGDTIQGFQYELSQAISHLSGLEVQIQLEMSLTKSYEALATGQCDLIARNLPITTQLRDTFLFTDPIVLNKQVLVQRKRPEGDSLLIRNQLDLARKTLYIPQDSPALFRIHNLAHEIGDTIFVIEEQRYSSEQLMIMVEAGEIDYAVCDQQIAKALQAHLPHVDCQTDISFTQLQSWAVRKSSPILLDSLNSWFQQLKQSGLYKTIYQKYYP